MLYLLPSALAQVDHREIPHCIQGLSGQVSACHAMRTPTLQADKMEPARVSEVTPS